MTWKSHKVRVILAVFYFGVWFAFGLLYQWYANTTNGRAFAFQEDLRVRSQVQEFKKMKDLHVDDEIIKNLIPTCTWDFAGGAKMNEAILVPARRNIGQEWAVYYSKKFESEGITHFAVKVIPGTLEESYKEDGMWRVGPLYKLEILLFHNASSDKPNKPVKSFPVFAIRPPIYVSPNFKSEVKYEIRGLPDILCYSAHFIDDSFSTLKKIVDGHHEYPLLDFLYFSAITITTVGYGDILPHDTSVRVLVMIESLTGVIILGFFLTTIGGHQKRL
jgi:voltage-gated potassium channel